MFKMIKGNKTRKDGKVDRRLGNPAAGRKPVAASQAKRPVQVYIEQYKIDALGGISRSRDIALSSLEQAYYAKTVDG